MFGIWSLGFGVSLELGAWSLELFLIIPPIHASRGAGFRHHNLSQQWQFRFQFLPDPAASAVVLASIATLPIARTPTRLGRFFAKRFDFYQRPLAAFAQWHRRGRLKKLQGGEFGVANAEPFLKVLQQNGIKAKLLSDCDALLTLPAEIRNMSRIGESL